MSHDVAALYYGNGYNPQAACEHCDGSRVDTGMVTVDNRDASENTFSKKDMERL